MTAQVSGIRQQADDELPPPVRTLLFAPLGATDMPSAVVHRLRAAIGLGLLADGKRLPKEADLAEQLGVTTFALREALAELRSQGLVVTRAGKYGGSFVTYPTASERLEHDELVDLSSAELRDLGDWRAMLAAHAAALAAHRASESNIRMLGTYATRVAEAETSLEARRAHGRFHLELASAAQSMRMTRAEFAVHEQIDWLFGLVLGTPEERVAIAEGLERIAAAVRRREPGQARLAAEEHVGQLVNRLAQLRLEGVAARQREQSGASATSLDDEVASVVRHLDAELRGFADDVAPPLASGQGFPEVRSSVALAGLQRFNAFPPFVKGLGILVEVGLVPERPYWIEWWLRTASGPVPDNHHVLDPAREDFYDYPSMEFMERPRQSHGPWAYGPYVDYGGVDDYILTIAAPILADGRFCGVSCADILVADLESWLSPLLAVAAESYLLNSEDRVIVSNSVTHGVGDVMREREGFRVLEFPTFGWSLLVRGDSPT